MNEQPGFAAFWAAWPANSGSYARKGCKAECAKRWKARHHETQADQIVKHVEWMKTTADWLKDRGMYIPAPLVYLNQQRWDGADIPVPQTVVDKTRAYIDSMGQGAVPPPEHVVEKMRRLRRVA